MFSTLLHIGAGSCIEALDDANIIPESEMNKIMGSVALLETIAYVGILLTSYLIRTDALPSGLQFLKGRMQLATGLMISGITGLGIGSIVGSLYRSSEIYH